MPDAAAPRHAAVVLAAGRARRFGARKQLLVVDGEPLVRRAVRAVLATAPVDTCVVIDRDAGEVRAAVDAMTGVRCIECAADLMAASLRAGLDALAADAAGALVVLADQPALSSERLGQLVETWRADVQRAVACLYRGSVGVPALLPRAWFPRLQPVRGDEGARSLLRAAGADVIAIDAPELAFDIDTPDDFARWLHARPTG